MQYKIYTLQHQKLYDQIYNISGDEKVNKIIEKEKTLLQERCKEIRGDFSILSKNKEFDALFSDVILMNKKTSYSYEQIAVIGNKIFVLERKKPYDNQKQLLKEKTNYLRKCIDKNIQVQYYILIEGKSSKQNHMKLDSFIEYAKTLRTDDGISRKVNEFIQNKHTQITAEDYIHKKYNINVKQKEVVRKSGWINILKYSNPMISKYKGQLSALSSTIIFLYIIIAAFSYSIYAKERQFMLTIALDALFLFVLVNILKEMESKLPRWLKNITLSGVLGGFVIMFGRIIYYF